MRFFLVGLSVLAAVFAGRAAFAQSSDPQNEAQTPPAQTNPVEPLSPPATLLGPLLPIQPISPPRVPSRSYLRDEVERGDTVLSRPRPDFDPLGLHWGGFLFFPELLTEESFNDNIYATENHRKSDFITAIQPNLDLRSNWNNHALNLHADARVLRYASHSSEDFEDYTATADGRIDVLHDFRLFGDLGYIVRHEPRGSANDLGAKEPQQYSVASAKAGAEKAFNRLSFRLDGSFDEYRYDSVRTAMGTLGQAGRNYDQYGVSLRSGYDFGPLRNFYVLTSYNWRSYIRSVDQSGFDRDSRGFFVGIGSQYDLTGIMFIDIAVGYREQNYDDSRLGTIRGPSGKARLTWNVTRLTTFTATVSRDIEETILPGAAAYFATRADLRVDHELLRNLLLDAHFGYERDSFKGIHRNDDYYMAGLGAKYLINRNFSLTGGYEFRHRTTDISNGNFDENVIFLRLSSHL